MVKKCFSLCAILQIGKFLLSRGNSMHSSPKQPLPSFQVWGADLIIVLYSLLERQGSLTFSKKKKKKEKTENWPPSCTQYTVCHLSSSAEENNVFTAHVWDEASTFSLQASDSLQDTMKATSKTYLLMVGIKEYSSGNHYKAGLSERVYH